MVRETATTSIENQKGRAVRGLGAVAQAVRQATDGLRAQGQHGVSDYIGQAADRIDGLAKSLEQKDFDEIVEDLQSFGRRNPALFLAAAFGMGLCIARFMRSSGEGMIGRSPAER